MTERVVVIGSGFAGWAAAFRLKEANWSPVLISSGVGASSMTSGAADLRRWTEEGRGAVSQEARAFVRALGLYGEGGVVATAEGVVRPTDGVGARVLDLGSLEGRVVGVADLPRADFRPREFARQLSQAPWAKQTRTTFEVVETKEVVSASELSYPLAAFQKLFDDERRVDALRDAARAHSSKIQGLLTGPFLGSARQSLDVPGVLIGETLSPPEGAFGSRVEETLGPWLRKAGIEVREHRVSSLIEEDDGVRLTLEDLKAGSGETTLWADAAVLASGGLIGHGVDTLFRESAPAVLGATLDSSSARLLGARDGWDATSDGGKWIHPPHYSSPIVHGTSSRIVLAGDVRGAVTRGAPGGTVFGAIESGLAAATRLLSD